MKINGTVITEASMRRAVVAMAAAMKKERTFEAPFWVDNKYFYGSEIARQMGFYCTPEELANAGENGFIKTAKGFDLYLSRPVPFV